MSLERQVVLTVFGLPVTTTVVATWGMVAVLSALAILAGSRVTVAGSGWQATLEWGVGALRDMLSSMTGSDGERYTPLVATVAIFVLVANSMGALPGVEAPTADVNTPIALALIVFSSVHYYGIRQLGVWGYLRRFAQPSIILLPINVLTHATRTLSLAIRLFGNMVSHQIIVAILLVMLPLVIPAFLELFGLFVGAIQAYIFTVLTIVYIGGAVRAEGEL